MVAKALKPALRAALRAHEIGSGSPYRLSFAGKGKSGASFGFMQGDLAARQPVAVDAFRRALAADGVAAGEINRLLAILSVHHVKNPLTLAETGRVNAALDGHRAIVDAMDEAILTGVWREVDRCTEAAASSQRTISDTALIYATLWINMSGPPSELLRWLRGEEPRLPTIPPPAAARVNAAAIQSYLQATDYYRRNPANFLHMKECVAIGAAKLP